MAQSKVKVVLNTQGVGALLKSAEMQALLAEHARRISGSDGETEVYVAGTRAVAVAQGNNDDNALLKRMR